MLAEILGRRFHRKITDAEAVAELVRAGETERAARDHLRLQDELLGNDCIIVDEEGREVS